MTRCHQASSSPTSANQQSLKELYNLCNLYIALLHICKIVSKSYQQEKKSFPYLSYSYGSDFINVLARLSRVRDWTQVLLFSS